MKWHLSTFREVLCHIKYDKERVIRSEENEDGKDIPWPPFFTIGLGVIQDFSDNTAVACQQDEGAVPKFWIYK